MNNNKALQQHLNYKNNKFERINKYLKADISEYIAYDISWCQNCKIFTTYETCDGIDYCNEGCGFAVIPKKNKSILRGEC